MIMTVIFKGEHFGLTTGKTYKVIPYPDRFEKWAAHSVRIENDFGQIFDYARFAFAIINPPVTAASIKSR